MSHILNKIIVPYSFYNKTYDTERDISEYTLIIKNAWYNILVRIVITDSCTSNDKTIIEILSNDVLQYTVNLESNQQIEALYYVQDFLFEHNLLLYIEGFGIVSFDNKVNIEQSKPTTTNEPNNNKKER